MLCICIIYLKRKWEKDSGSSKSLFPNKFSLFKRALFQKQNKINTQKTDFVS